MKRDLKKGIWYSSLPGKTPLEKFQAAKAAGFDGVEPPCQQDQEAVLRARDATGLAIPSVSCGTPGRSITQADPAKRAEGAAGIEQGLRDAKRYSASSVLVVAGRVDKSIAYADAYTRAQETLRKVAPLAEELDIKLAIENVWNHFLLSPLEAARFVDELRSPAAGWQFDIGNAIYQGWPEHWIRILGPRIQKIHVKEFSRKKMNERGPAAGFAVEFLEGDNDWPAVMKALDDVGYRAWATVEPAWTPVDVEPAARLKQIVAKLELIIAS